MRSRCVVLLQLSICLGMTTPSIAATIADSEADWSFDGQQGENGWYNGWYNFTQDDDATYAPDKFMPFLNDDSEFVEPDGLNHWNGTGWNLYRDTAATAGAETGPWTIIDSLHGHPNGLNSAAAILVDEPEQAEHWPIRRWVSTYAGPVSVTSSIADANLGCGTGTSVELYHNGVLIDKLTTDSDTELTNTVGATLAVGDMLDLALTPEGTDGDRADPCDGTNFRLAVTDEAQPPASGDFNANGVLDVGDIDDLSGQSAGGQNPAPYDLNSDALVNGTDINVWVKDQPFIAVILISSSASFS
jgi:hypothetical protein